MPITSCAWWCRTWIIISSSCWAPCRGSRVCPAYVRASCSTRWSPARNCPSIIWSTDKHPLPEDPVSYAEFEALALPLTIFALVAFMGFIVWDLAKQSKAGRWGTAVLFFALGLGVVGFVIKAIILGNVEGF